VSYLSPPRICFISKNATANAATANNNDVVVALDAANVKLMMDGKSQEEFRKWLIEPVTLVSSDEDFPHSMKTERAFWNYYGDNALSFGDARINGICKKDGTWLTADPPADPLFGARVSIDARMVDLDPTSTFTTQIFSSLFRITVQNERGRNVDLLRGLDPSPAYLRWLNMKRPYGAAVFQCVIERDQLTTLADGYSPALDEFMTAIQEADGITLRYCLYAFAFNPPATAEERAKRSPRGAHSGTPRTGRVLGSITAWHRDEMKSVPMGRLLYSPRQALYIDKRNVDTPRQPIPPSSVRSHADLDLLWADAASTSRDGAQQTDGETGPSPYIGPAVAVVDTVRNVVMLDLLSTFPEPAADRLDEKVYVGPVSLEARTRQQQITIGSVPYDRAIYEAQAGIVDVPYTCDASRVQQGWLVLTHPPRSRYDDELLLAEVQTVAVETDDRCVYLDLGDPDRREVEIELWALTRGQPRAEDNPVVGVDHWQLAYQGDEVNRPATDAEAMQNADRSLPTVTRPNKRLAQVALAARCSDRSIAIPDSGKTKLKITAQVPGCFTVRFLPPPLRVAQSIPITSHGTWPDLRLDFCVNVRVLPADEKTSDGREYSALKDEDITWDLVYKEVFEYYALIYPIMSTIVPWSSPDGAGDEARIREFATLIRAFIDDEKNRQSPLYMPITRELSRGKRDLVRRWCILQMKAMRHPTTTENSP
jgi:hypothetical protein